MLEVSSEDLSSFIHWYYWSLQLGQLVIFYTLISLLLYITNCKINIDNSNQNVEILGWIFLFPSIFQAIHGVIVLHRSKSHLYIDVTRPNPLKSIINVLSYAWNPVNCSAFTYWENDIPSRIDLGKRKYGGPFTNEQVEEVKTLLRLLILIISLLVSNCQASKHESVVLTNDNKDE